MRLYFQDSYQDFQEQAAAMTAVSLGCTVCIAAVGGSKAGDGLFSQRDPRKFALCYIFHDKRSDCSGEDTRLEPSTRRLNPTDPWPVHRAWAIQERLLPPRMIIFGSYLSWKCRGIRCGEFDYKGSLFMKLIKPRLDTLRNILQETVFDRTVFELAEFIRAYEQNKIRDPRFPPKAF